MTHIVDDADPGQGLLMVFRGTVPEGPWTLVAGAPSSMREFTEDSAEKHLAEQPLEGYEQVLLVQVQRAWMLPFDLPLDTGTEPQ